MRTRPCSHQRARSWEGCPVEFVDDSQYLVFHLAGGVDVDPAHPGRLAIFVMPRPNRIGEAMELSASIAFASPDIGKRLAEFGMPRQGWEIVERDDHAHMIDGVLGDRSDRPVSNGWATEEENVSSVGGVGRFPHRQTVCHGRRRAAVHENVEDPWCRWLAGHGRCRRHRWNPDHQAAATWTQRSKSCGSDSTSASTLLAESFDWGCCGR